MAESDRGWWYKQLRVDEWKAKFDFTNSGVNLSDPYDLCVGKYDFKFLCMPQWPYCRKRFQLKELKPPPFFAVDQMMSIFLAAVMGLQHALAMTGGLVTPALIITMVAQDITVTQYLVSASLICSGLFTIVHVWQIPLPFTNRYYGTGVISVIGISFTFLPISQSAIGIMMGNGATFAQAYGSILGTIICCFWIVVLISFMPAKWIRRIFPPMVSGVTIFLIGAALIKSGFQAWGGGVFCATYAEFGMPPKEIPSCQIPKNTSLPIGPGNPYVSAPCFPESFKPLCGGNGDVLLPFGSPQYIGMGAVVFLTLIAIEIFGSPFLRNTQVIIGLMVGYIVAAIVKIDGKSFINYDKISNAPVMTFLWAKTFPLSVYGPAILPFLIGLIVTSVECVGDITATEEASELSTTGHMHRMRIAGGLLGDGFNVLWGALATTLPSTTFAQNNGVIVLTRCASRVAGVACGLWLVGFGIFAKVGGFITSIPDCVLGGMTTFLFANVCISGVKIISLGDLTRRSRFILAIAVGLGLGVSLVPSWPLLNLWPHTKDMSVATASFRDAVIIVLETGFSLGCIVCILLHLLLPFEETPGREDEELPDYENPAGLYDSTADLSGTVPPTHHHSVDYNKPIFPRDHTSTGKLGNNGAAMDEDSADRKVPRDPMSRVEMAEMKR